MSSLNTFLIACRSVILYGGCTTNDDTFKLPIPQLAALSELHPLPEVMEGKVLSRRLVSP